ncbi:MAG: glycosyltransferase family 4 protein [Anaerolineales bacterium]|nr:glycosyltransferase family 4 protein [Anaerolineales bacterium]
MDKYVGSVVCVIGHQVIGISARLASEKGVEVLLRALPQVRERFPEAIVLHAGPYQNIMGEEAYYERLQPLLAEQGDHYRFLGTLHGSELTAFYKNLDVLTIPSLNSTESFGLVQIEAMSHGVPVVASNLPGVRQPVTMTGMGEVTPIGDHAALARGLIQVLSHKDNYLRPAEPIATTFAPDNTAQEYATLYEKLRRGELEREATEPAGYNQLRQLNSEHQPT